jgi:hypothetical protein
MKSKAKLLAIIGSQGCRLHKRSWIGIISLDLPPFLRVNVKGVDDISEVLRNNEGIGKCKKWIEKFIDSIRSGDFATLLLKS